MNGRLWWKASSISGWICGLVMLLSPLSALADTSPPQDLHLVGDHWTAWNPPTSFPEGTQVHTIQSGDTLWNLAVRHLGMGELWPQIWEQNQYILDAHWIYPGDPLLIAGTQPSFSDAEGIVAPPLEDGAGSGTADGGTGMADLAAEQPLDTLAEGSGSGEDAEDTGAGDTAFLDRSSGTDAPVPLGNESDIYCSGYIGDLEEAFAYQVSGSEYESLTPVLDPQRDSEIKGLWGKADTEKYGLGLGDIVYIDGGRADGLSPGELLTAVDRREKVIHPITEVVIGQFYQYVGRVRVLSAQEDTAIGEIVLSCYPLSVGTYLKFFEPEPVPLRRLTPMRPSNLPPRAEELAGAPIIIRAQDNIISLGKGHVVFLDHGADQNVAAGDIYTIFRRSRAGHPPVVLGEVAVLSVSKNTSLARILESRYSIFIGDDLLLK